MNKSNIESWSTIPRNNLATLYPSDFELFQVSRFVISNKIHFVIFILYLNIITRTASLTDWLSLLIYSRYMAKMKRKD